MGHVLMQIHNITWIVMAVLFLASLIAYRQKVWSMVLRLSYVVMLVTGVWMLIRIHFPAVFVVKGILALLLIGLMEMALGRRQKQKSVILSLLFVVIDLLLILLIGYKII